jgi:hypothetical protein
MKMVSKKMNQITAKLKDGLRWAQRRCEYADRPAPTITLRWLEQRWRQQRGIFPIFRLPMDTIGPLGATLDQIEPGKGYTRRNTQIVAKAANAFKGNMTMRETRALLRKIK